MKCRVCSSTNLSLALDLGFQPWANNFLTKDQIGTEQYYPLRVVHCDDCKTAQLDHTVPKETMFSEHSYRSGTTRTLYDHFRGIAHDIHHMMPHGQSVLDIGSNDGTQLQCFKELGWNTLGVESCASAAKVAEETGIPTINKFFNEETAQDIGVQFDIINASGVFFHLEELHSVCRGVKHLLDKDGVFIVQFIYAKTMLENGAFDQIYHEHLLYYTMRSITYLLQLHGLRLFDAKLSPIHGGSMIAHVCHVGAKWQDTARAHEFWYEEHISGCNSIEYWYAFKEKINDIKINVLRKLHEWKDGGKRVYGLGSPVKGNTFLNTFGITADLIQFLTERNPLRDGLYAPGSHIPIVMEDAVNPPGVYVVLAWNFKEEIMERNKHLVERGVEFYFPIGA